MYNNSVSGLLPTKFYFPPVPAGFVPRPQLLKKLDEALLHRLTLVSAPAGSGKTTLVSAWIQSARKKGAAFGWLSLDSADNDPGRFLEYLAACLEEGGTVIDLSTLPLVSGRPVQLEDTLAELIRGLMDLKREVILVLDDYHLIQNKQVHEALQFFLSHVPASFHLVLLTRSDPPLELARLRVAGQLGELRMDHLRFSAREAGEFLKASAGLQLGEAQVNALNARAEGWIAGLQMAAISLRGNVDTDAFIAAFAGSHRYVFDYLIEQVLDRQTPQMREFLLRTSILERMSAPLCDAVAGTECAARGLLDTIEHGNLFLVPLDDEHGWYRYHHLFSDLLQLVLEQSHPGLKPALHHLACHWFEGQALLPEALQHGLAAEDMELVARIVSENVLTLVEHAEIMPILARIEAVPLSQRASMPWLEVAYAWGLAYICRNEASAQALTHAEAHMEGLAGERRAKMQGHIAAVRAYITWTNGDFAGAVAFAEQANELLPAQETAVRALNLTTLGNALIQIGEDLRSAETLEQAILLAKQAGQSHVIMPAVSGLAYTYMIMGRFRRAGEICEEAIRMAEAYQRRNAHSLTASACVYASMSRVLMEAGEFEKAVQTGRKAVALSLQWGQVDTIMISYLYLAKSLILAGQLANGREIIARARKIAQNASRWHVENAIAAEVESWLDSDPQDAAQVRQETAPTNFPSAEFMDPIRSRVLLKQNRPAEARDMLEQEIAEADSYSSFRKVGLAALLALAYYQTKDTPRALAELEKALSLGAPENRVATFVREGTPMEKLLRLAQPRSAQSAFIRKILAAFDSRRKTKPEPAAGVGSLIEPLSERELEVLQHMNTYLSTPEIADVLVVSANTVRTHIKSIYAKLDVHGRSGAIRRAGELGLLG